MEQLQQIISDLINEHGQEAVQEAVNNHTPSANAATDGDPVPPNPTHPPQP